MLNRLKNSYWFGFSIGIFFGTLIGAVWMSTRIPFGAKLGMNIPLILASLWMNYHGNLLLYPRPVARLITLEEQCSMTYQEFAERLGISGDQTYVGDDKSPKNSQDAGDYSGAKATPRLCTECDPGHEPDQEAVRGGTKNN